MQITQDWTRKRTAHKAACWTCYRCHRACDGERPCKRCSDLGRGSSCRSPTPNERLIRKRKKPKPDEDLPDEHPPPHKIRKPFAGFFVVNPQTSSSRSGIDPNSDIEDTPLSSPFPSISSLSPTYRPFCDQDRNHNGFFDHKEILSRPTPLPYQSNAHTTNAKPHRPKREYTASYSLPRKQQTQITKTDDYPLTIDMLLAEFGIETEETSTHQKTTSSVFASLTIPDDLMQLSESLFTPFGLRDSTQVCPLFVKYLRVPFSSYL